MASRSRRLSWRQEIARRIASAADDVLPFAREHIRDRILFRHTVANADLPERQRPAEPFCKTDPAHPIEFHVLCLGDGALGTSPFELYLDYAARIEARSRTVLTLLVEFSSGCSGCLPTTKAVQGGGHSADADRLGPEGGQVLVEKSVRSINELWP